MAEDMYLIVKEEVDKVKCDEGGFNSGHLWRLKNKLRPKFNNYPTAMHDKEGKLVTTKTALKTLAMEHYKKVLEDRPIVEGLQEYKREREALCEKRIKEASKNVTPEWTEEDVKCVVKKLKKKKSRDPHGYSNELFQYGGSDVFCALTKLMNGIKNQHLLFHQISTIVYLIFSLKI